MREEGTWGYLYEYEHQGELQSGALNAEWAELHLQKGKAAIQNVRLGDGQPYGTRGGRR